MNLRVAHIIANLNIGGAERNVVNLVNELDCAYRGLITLGPEGESTLRDDLSPNVDQRFVRIRRRSVATGILKLSRLLRELQVNVVHTHMFSCSLYGSIAAKLAGVPVVVTTEHGENPWKRWTHKWLERCVISRLVDLRLCVSPRILELRRDSDGIPSEKLRLFVNGTVLPEVQGKNSDRTVPVIGAVGRMVPAKDFPCLLRAFSILRERKVRFEACLIGDGPERSKLVALCKDLRLDTHLRMPGMVQDMRPWYCSFDVFASSSVREGLPLSMLEAMAHGVPVLATDVGACAETVGHGFGGLVVPAGDPVRLADGLQRLLEDEDLRRELGRNARARVEDRFSIGAVATAHLELYEELLARGRSRHPRVA